MKITTPRRISQIFFVSIFLWFCFVMTLGKEWWKLRGWSVNLFLNLDPLTGISTILTTRSLYSGLLWGLLTVILTIALGRFFCGWLCPFGAIHQFIGFIAHRKRKFAEKVQLNRYHPAQSVKYAILIFCLSGPVIGSVFGQAASLQTGLLDPIPLLHRSVNLALLPFTHHGLPRFYEGAGSVGIVFLIAVLMNLLIPRFYCRFICPLGALFGILSRFAIWRVVTTKETKDAKCTHCRLCERNCEGACEPSEKLRLSECVLCLNCLHECKHDLIGYGTGISHNMISPDLSKREFVVSAAVGLAVIPMLRLDGYTVANWNPALIRPPGALAEKEFLARCIKCGQCMRICPTNVIQPSGLIGGVESLWTPVLNFRIGTSGCQMNCIACGHSCPTAAIRPLSIDERMGLNAYKEKGPVRMGTAFVDRNRCLPWAMDKPCIVCQENCPVSPKSITTLEYFSQLPRYAKLMIKKADALHIELESNALEPNRFSTGDYYVMLKGDTQPRNIVENTANSLKISSLIPFNPAPAGQLEIQVRLQRPIVDPARCIGCGVCEHECLVRGQRAIRVSAENESRHREHALLV